MDDLSISLVLHPGAERNRSMVLYAERLAQCRSEGQHRQVHTLKALPGVIGGRLSEIIVPPFAMPRIKTDIVHIVDHAHAGYLRFTRRRSVVTVHDLIPLKVLAGEYSVPASLSRKAAFWFRYNISALSRADRIICPSQATVDDVKRLLALDSVVVPNGVEERFFEDPGKVATQAVTQRLQGLPRKLLLQVSTGLFYKNDDGFAKVFAEVAERLPALAWVRLGSPLPPEHRRWIDAHGYADRVLEYGPATLDELIALYRRADLLLFPSWDEGFGWPPLEAMAAGCPVVSSAAGSLRETAAPAALTAAPNDTEQLARHVLRVLSDEGLAVELSERGRRHAAKFNWEDSAGLLAKVYEEVGG